ncbi:helix-turn-helix transcriptional regulator [Roseinatronobacter bogoriensis]|uniref:LuxR family transcriptional regulator n=1 Tax=Roseinatronobacter bogoriensis subsp. barguzinensis TaxID=441209 RepID=A0A2K8KA12_9RHOB|nr:MULTISPECIES: helix-turn-helix transcriptional regulator [Rhodobaca]ATX64545.1 LuxR family transcriptional regulator [Rhodobaca barguzinensis]MBB4209725.1 DNA-binding CsgD family transcriptional regulator [Rhodobaca bogoriensis DSM 18756]TDW33723.1 regulatory LuxR family protein [Rhodobaca barguzinensis]TDY66194.1 regulatory LuxR family protein [Rhodobaca bogoriensis DSM 18756]
MDSIRSIYIGIALVLLIAFGKTALVSTFFLEELLRTGPVLLLLYLIFAVLTGFVFFVLQQFFGHLIVPEDKFKTLSTTQNEPGKEVLVELHAKDWGLSKAETEVAILVVKGFSNAEIADIRGSVLSTVKTQLGSIYQKSGLENRYQLMAFITDEVCEAAKATQINHKVSPRHSSLKDVSAPNPEADVANVTTHPNVELFRKRVRK